MLQPSAGFRPTGYKLHEHPVGAPHERLPDTLRRRNVDDEPALQQLGQDLGLVSTSTENARSLVPSSTKVELETGAVTSTIVAGR